MNIEVIADLERRYQKLVQDFQSGHIDETTFVSQVDGLQFQDESGRYWMMGSQTGAWHYYDGQSWHQADPRDADKLPFVDEQGRYWQQGTTSGEWYYYQPDTDEWVKPSADDPAIPGRGGVERPGMPPYQSHLYPQSAESGPDMPSQLDGELFQDDEGRYWMVGAKTGQWYFYDYDGWHAAHEFQQAASPQPMYQPYQGQPASYEQASYAYQPQQPQMPYQQPYQGYAPQQPYQQPATPPQYTQPAQQPAAAPPPPDYAAQTQPAQTETSQPSVSAQPVESAAEAAPAAKSNTTEIPNPPTEKSDSGVWYYFDGKQWLKYSSGEPAEDVPPPNSEMILDQQPEPAKPKTEKKPEDEPVVAELFEEEEDNDDIEVVDVEVITVIEAEPDEIFEPEPEPIRMQAAESTASAPPDTEEIRPRRVGSRPVQRVEPASPPTEPRRQPKDRTITDTGRMATPRKRDTDDEPTIIIPTESSASGIGSARATRPVRPNQPGSRPVQPTSRPGQPVRPSSQPIRPNPSQQRRARENTIPMGAVGAAGAAAARDVTQPLPVAREPRSDTDKIKIARAREDTKPDTPVQAKATPASKPVATQAKTEKSGYTLGEILRAVPGTVWTFVGGMIVLFITFALIGVAAYSLLGNNGSEDSAVTNLTLPQNLTPTLDAAMADTTPTPAPTPEQTPAPIVSPQAQAMTNFSSSGLGFAVDYPENWQSREGAGYVAFSPSVNGLDPDNIKDTSLWVGTTDATDNTDILAEMLTDFPENVQTLNQGTISMASQTWTSAQIEFEDENLGGRGIATLAVTGKDGVGYYLVAIANADQWNMAQPLFQEMINSFTFVETVAAATPAPIVETAITTPTVEATEETAAAPAIDATPVTYIVETGDTLLGIAVRFNVDSELLASTNGINDPNDLRVGQELTIPFTDEELAAYLSGGGTSAADNTTETTGSTETTPTDTEETETAADAPAEAGEAAPVGGRIAYPAYNPGINSYDIWLVDVASGNQSVIAGNASQPAFNKDGSLFAYRSWDLATRGIFFRDFIGGRGGQVTRFVEDGLPTWSPDGYSFAFMSRREFDRAARIYRGDQLGQSDTPIGFQGEYPSTFPDGRLVVKGCTPTGDCGLFIIGPNGGGETKISGEAADTAPAVSPDGSKIAFMSSARGARNWEIWVMNPDGSSPQQLTSNGSNDGLPAWSPDGQSIAFVSDQGGAWAVWVMNADGSNQRKLFNMNGSPDGQVLHDTSNSRGWLEERLTWAP